MLGSQTPVEASKTSEGRVKLEELLAFYDHMNAQPGATFDSDSGFNCNPPSLWVRWKLGIDQNANGAIVFAKEEAFFKGDDGEAATALYSTGGGVAAEGSKITCNFCLAEMEKPKVCAKCKCRRYCSVECQRGDWKEHKKYCVQGGGSGPKKPRGTLNEEYDKLKQFIIERHVKYEGKPYPEKTAFARGICFDEKGEFIEPPAPSWSTFLTRANTEGIVTQEMVDDDVNGREINIKNKKVLENLQLFHFKAFMMAKPPQIQAQIDYCDLRQKTVMESFSGRLEPALYLGQPQRRVGKTYGIILLISSYSYC